MEIPVSIEVSGTYHDVAVFFDRVGRMERIINILNVSMQPVSERSTVLTTTCDAVTYRFKGDSNVSKQGKK
jgi:type IV pilus assembly protein PilO